MTLLEIALKSMGNQEIRSCLGKHKHATFESASNEVNRTNKKRGKHTKGLKIGVYWCKFCKFYHVGHAPKKKR